jgi:hypothetical protein
LVEEERADKQQRRSAEEAGYFALHAVVVVAPSSLHEAVIQVTIVGRVIHSSKLHPSRAMFKSVPPCCIVGVHHDGPAGAA